MGEASRAYYDVVACRRDVIVIGRHVCTRVNLNGGRYVRSELKIGL